MAKVRVVPPRLTVPSEPKVMSEVVDVDPVFPASTTVFASVIELMVVFTLPPTTVMPAARPAVLETYKVVVLALARPERKVPPRTEGEARFHPEAVTSPPSTSVPPAKLTTEPLPPVLLKLSPATVWVLPPRSKMAPPLSVTVAPLLICPVEPSSATVVNSVTLFPFTFDPPLIVRFPLPAAVTVVPLAPDTLKSTRPALMKVPPL